MPLDEVERDARRFRQSLPGRRFKLLSGLLEISYDSGARVILEGPCDYAVESKTAGFLSLGRVTARVEAKKQKPEATPAPTDDRSGRFVVHTPTATITDLGTEFGVEVDQSGASQTHVFQGKVEMRANGEKDAANGPISLTESQSASVGAGQDVLVLVTRKAAHPESFVREIPKRVRIKLFNTGVNAAVGSPDQHWQVVARTDERGFQPRPAVVTEAGGSMWLVNQVDRSQWISLTGGESMAPNSVTYTFRTTFELAGVRPATAVVHGWFAVDNHLRAIRLNGRPVPVPKHGQEEFGFFHPFSIDRGFVEGVNVIEFDVDNGVDHQAARLTSPMGLLVELEGSVLSARPVPAARTTHREKATKK